MTDKTYDFVRRALASRAFGWLALAAAAIGMALRFVPPVFGCVATDMEAFLLPWVRTIHDGGFAAYGEAFSDYAPLYTYLLWPVSLLPEGAWAAGIKILSILADVVLAVATALTVSQVCGGESRPLRRNLGLLAGVAVLWLPSVWMNSAMWGQCDAMWVGCVMLSLLMFLKDRPMWGMTWFAVAFALKMQAVFFSPVILLLLLSGRARWWQVLIVPAVYVITCIPCVAAGRGWGEMLTVYVAQGQSNPEWCCNAPNLYRFITYAPTNPAITIAIMALVSLLTLWLCIAAARRFRAMDHASQMRILLIFTAFCGVFYPWALTGMHERYFYLGDIATLAAAVALMRDPRLWAAAIFTEAASAMSVRFVLSYRYEEFGVIETGAVLTTAALALLMVEMYKYLKHNKIQ